MITKWTSKQLQSRLDDSKTRSKSSQNYHSKRNGNTLNKARTCVDFHPYSLFCQDCSNDRKHECQELSSFLIAQMKGTNSDRNGLYNFFPPKRRRGFWNESRAATFSFWYSRPCDQNCTFLLGLRVVGCNEP